MAPLWSYELGWRNGWIPHNPREAIGICESILHSSAAPTGDVPYATGLISSTASASTAVDTRSSGIPAPTAVSSPSFDGTYSSWMTGGEGAFLATGASAYPWPPRSISNTFSAQTSLPTYAVTGTPITLPPPTFTFITTVKKSIVVSMTVMPTSGFPPGKALAPTPSSGCNYPPAWDAQGVIFTQSCTRT